MNEVLFFEQPMHIWVTKHVLLGCIFSLDLGQTSSSRLFEPVIFYLVVFEVFRLIVPFLFQMRVVAFSVGL